MGLALGYVADRVFGDPGRGHPVAGFGWLATRLEALTYGDARWRGVVHGTVLVGASAGLGAALHRWPRGPKGRAAVMAVATWAVLGGRSLEREALAVGDLLGRGDLPGSRAQVGRLVGRETARLDAGEVARAAVESVAENTSDAVVALSCGVPLRAYPACWPTAP